MGSRFGRARPAHTTAKGPSRAQARAFRGRRPAYAVTAAHLPPERGMGDRVPGCGLKEAAAAALCAADRCAFTGELKARWLQGPQAAATQGTDRRDSIISNPAERAWLICTVGWNQSSTSAFVGPAFWQSASVPSPYTPAGSCAMRRRRLGDPESEASISLLRSEPAISRRVQSSARPQTCHV